jgi:hypothetical protein
VKLQFFRLCRILASTMTTAAVLGAASGVFAPANAATGPVCDTDSCAITYSYTGATEPFTVPTGVNAVTVSVSGAQGSSWVNFRPGGNGATVHGVLPVTPGEQLTVLVGQAGSVSGSATFGGGGASTGQYLGSGGGGSFIFDPDGEPLVAAGGGGSATDAVPSGGVGAGAGGTGGSGTGIGYSGETPPTGGSPTAGGIHGATGFSNGNDGTGPAANGQPGKGGDGAGLPGDPWVGGGGGGGYYGGGGGAYAQAGAGGSGYADPSMTDLTSTNGANGGNGVVSISWALPPQTITFTSPVPPSVVAGSTLDVTTTGGASGNPVSLTVDSSSTNSVCSITASTVSFDHAGTCVVNADQAGDAQYAPALTAQASVVVTTVPSVLSLTSAPAVFGQAIRVTSTVSTGSGTPDGTVQFAVDGKDIGSPVTLVGGSAQSPALTKPSGDPLAPSAHAVTASYRPTDPTVYAAAAGSTTQVIDRAATSTRVTVDASSISAAVSAVAPGVGAPTGTVTFSVAGHSVGAVALVNGMAVLPHVVPAGTTRTVAAVYSGDDSFSASSASTSRSDPSLTASVSSAQPKSQSGWYRTPVTVTFNCDTHGAALTEPCPAAVQFAADGAAQSTTRTITAADGGVATVTVAGINLDRTPPSVTVNGIKNGARYGGKAPAAHCVARDGLSGIASCTITRHTRGSLTHYTAAATDKAGNSATVRGRYRLLDIYLAGTPYRAGAFTLRAGRSYTVVVTGHAGRPTYYDAALNAHKHTHRNMAFNAAGHHRWVLGITPARSMRSHHYWYLGVKIGHKMHSVKVRVTG